MALLPGTLRAQATDSLSAARRVVAAASLAAREYSLGVAPGGGSITLPEEVNEAKLFIEQARFDLPFLPARVRVAADSDLTALTQLVARLAPPAEVEARSGRLIGGISAAVGGVVEPLPARPPSLARGADLYRSQCAECHGLTGRGDGRKAAGLKGPPPANLADPLVMGDVAPVDVFRRITIGVPGTGMPEFEQDLPIDDRWALTAYVLTMSGRAGVVQAAAADVFTAVRRQLDSAVAQRSERLAFNAYLTFEQVETDVRAKQSRLASRLEDGFATLRGRIAAAPPDELTALARRLLADLELAERVVADRGSRANLFAQSLILMVREGFEAILIIGALMAFLTRAGASARRREVARGAWGAVAASVVTWALVQFLFRITPAQREAIEGFTMLLAMVVLFYVSYWLLSKIEVARWNAFVKGKMEAALSTGSGLALAAVAFLAVYREGFETILFYEALLSSSGSSGIAPVLAGIGAGAVVLVGVYVAVIRSGLRLPMKPFFAVTSAVLYYMAFVFAGKGIAELQTAGVLSLTPVSWGPRVPLLGVYPTVESLLVQGALLVLAIGALVWVRLSVGGEPSGGGRQAPAVT